MDMMRRCVVVLACAAFGVGGCASVQPQGALLTGECSARVTGLWPGERADDRPAVILVEHVFELTNSGSDAAIIVSHRTRIDTTWHFADSGNARLPRSINPGETVPVAVTGKVRRPGPQRFFVNLSLATGDVVALELLVDD